MCLCVYVFTICTICVHDMRVCVYDMYLCVYVCMCVRHVCTTCKICVYVFMRYSYNVCMCLWSIHIICPDMSLEVDSLCNFLFVMQFLVYHATACLSR